MGQVGGQFAGAPLLLLHSTGAKSGQERVHPMMYLADGDRYLVFASKAGAPTNPDWYHNIKAHPDVIIEVGNEDDRGACRGGRRRVNVTASTPSRRSCTQASPTTSRRRTA